MTDDCTTVDTSTLHHVYGCGSNLRGNLMHDLGGGIFQGILQVVLEVAEELPGSSLHHIQQPSSVASIHVWGETTFSHQNQETNKKQKQIRRFHLSSDF